MQNIAGFLLTNGYAFLVLLTTAIIFYAKPRLKKTEDNVYSKFLMANLLVSISGLILGFAVSPNIAVNQAVIKILNKVYLFGLLSWIIVLTYYIVYVSLKNKSKLKNINIITGILVIISTIIIIFFDVNVEVLPDLSAVPTGIPVIYVYLMFGILYIIQLVCISINYKDIKNKKYTPVYVLLGLLLFIIVLQIVLPSTNYIINPTLIFVAIIMYHTIENPDTKVIEELTKSKEITSSSNKEKSLFSYNLAQGIKKPVNEIYEYSDYIIESNDVEKIKEAAREIKNSSRSIYNTINGVLDVSQIMLSKSNIVKNKYNLTNLLKETEKMLTNNLKNKDVKLNIDISHDLPEYLYGDQIRLKQIINIVINNAIKFTKEGLISYRVNCLMQQDMCRLIIVVEDTGCGMKEEYIDKIKQRNKELTIEEIEKLEEKNDHLTIAYALAKTIGGTLIIDSIIDKGTKITIVLDQQVSENSSVMEKYISKQKILLVDDNEKDIAKEKKKLANYDINLVVSKSGESCLLKMRKKEPFDLIIMKEKMEKLSGIDIMRKLKRIEDFNIPVILLTDETEDMVLNSYNSLGFKDYIKLPIEDKELDKKLKKYLK